MTAETHLTGRPRTETMDEKLYSKRAKQQTVRGGHSSVWNSRPELVGGDTENQSISVMESMHQKGKIANI